MTTLVGFDLETTGVDVETARIVTASIVTYTDRVRTSTRDWLINPGIDIPEQATAVHGITTEHARTNGQDPKAALPEIYALLRQAETVAIYNAPYDLTVLDRELRRHVTSLLPWKTDQIRPVIDPMVIDKHVDRYRRGKRTLTATCDVYGITLDDAHTSAADADAAVQLTYRIFDRNLGLPASGLDALHDAQVQWFAEQSASFAAYLTKQADHADAEEAAALQERARTANHRWPLQPHNEGATS